VSGVISYTFSLLPIIFEIQPREICLSAHSSRTRPVVPPRGYSARATSTLSGPSDLRARGKMNPAGAQRTEAMPCAPAADAGGPGAFPDEPNGEEQSIAAAALCAMADTSASRYGTSVPVLLHERSAAKPVPRPNSGARG
jgi:hypothetical protein